MNSPVEKIKERLSIIDVVSSYIQIIKVGKSYKAKCPFHNEKTPSFYVSPERESFYCFGCGAKGDIFSFVEQFEGLDFKGALKLLADRAGVKLEDYHSQPQDKNDRYYQILEEATKFFEYNLSNNPLAKDYLKGRGLKELTIKNFRIGYAKEEWRLLLDYLLKKKFRIEEIEEVGLIKNSGKNYYDRFRGRIIFPICDSSGRVIAFTGRIFTEDEKKKDLSDQVSKYLNSPETPLFNKSSVLFGIDKAKNAIRIRDYSILVEGQLDLILAHQIGFTNTIAISGTALSENVESNDKSHPEEKLQKINNLGLIKRLSNNIILAFDGDQAGIKAVGRSSLIALSLGMQVKIAILPEGKDPADIILTDKDKWKNIIKNSVNIINFYLDKICHETSDIRKKGQRIKNEIFPYLFVIESAIEKASYISLINQKTNIPIEAINLDFQKFSEEKKDTFSQEIKNNKKEENHFNKKKELIERYLGIISWNRKLNNINKDIDRIDKEFKENVGSQLYDEVYKIDNSSLQTFAFQAEMWYGEEIEKTLPDLDEFVLNLEEELLNEKISELKEEINKKETKEDELAVLLKEFQNIVGRIEKIKYLRGQ